MLVKLPLGMASDTRDVELDCDGALEGEDGCVSGGMARRANGGLSEVAYVRLARVSLIEDV